MPDLFEVSVVHGRMVKSALHIIGQKTISPTRRSLEGRNGAYIRESSKQDLSNMRWSPVKANCSYVIDDAKGQSEVVLNVGGIVGQVGADVVSLEQTQPPMFCQVIVEASTGLERKAAGARSDCRTFGIEAVEAMHAAEESLSKDLIARGCRGAGVAGIGVARAAHKGHFVNSTGRSARYKIGLLPEVQPPKPDLRKSVSSCPLER